MVGMNMMSKALHTTIQGKSDTVGHIPTLLTWTRLCVRAISMCQNELASDQRGTANENFSAGFSSDSSFYSLSAGGKDREEARQNTLLLP